MCIRDSKIIIGSEGTLGIVLSAKLKVLDKPKKRILFIIEYESVFEAAKNSLEINKTNPSTLEFVDKNTLKHIKFNFSKNICCKNIFHYRVDVIFYILISSTSISELLGRLFRIIWLYEPIPIAIALIPFLAISIGIPCSGSEIRSISDANI